jgi:hypothetical protein
MEIISTSPSCNCGDKGNENETNGLSSLVPFILSSPSELEKDVACCGQPAGPPASPHERPGYNICPYVDGFMETGAGYVPRIKTGISLKDRLNTIRVRLNIGRNHYRIAPGLYAVGNPDKKSPVIVTANYKLSFDHLRKELNGTDAFILVLDTRGINVWCAAGKKTFGTDELVNRIRATGLSRVVEHREIVVPQLGAPGVSSVKVKKQSGFSILWGPVYAKDLPLFLKNGMKADPSMREPSFNLIDRLVLIPVELSIALKPALISALVLYVISGLGPGFFTFSSMVNRGLPAVLAFFSGVIAGSVLTPALLPRLPGTMFSVKGAAAGIITAFCVAILTPGSYGFTGVLGLTSLSASVSSWLAMNFTGATPFTSPSGVEKEMKRSMPFQIAGAFAGLILWIVSAF